MEKIKLNESQLQLVNDNLPIHYFSNTFGEYSKNTTYSTLTNVEDVLQLLSDMGGLRPDDIKVEDIDDYKKFPKKYTVGYNFRLTQLITLSNHIKRKVEIISSFIFFCKDYISKNNLNINVKQFNDSIKFFNNEFFLGEVKIPYNFESYENDTNTFVSYRDEFSNIVRINFIFENFDTDVNNFIINIAEKMLSDSIMEWEDNNFFMYKMNIQKGLYQYFSSKLSTDNVPILSKSKLFSNIIKSCTTESFDTIIAMSDIEKQNKVKDSKILFITEWDKIVSDTVKQILKFNSAAFQSIVESNDEKEIIKYFNNIPEEFYDEIENNIFTRGNFNTNYIRTIFYKWLTKLLSQGKISELKDYVTFKLTEIKYI